MNKQVSENCDSFGKYTQPCCSLLCNLCYKVLCNLLFYMDLGTKRKNKRQKNKLFGYERWNDGKCKRASTRLVMVAWQRIKKLLKRFPDFLVGIELTTTQWG